MLSSRAHESAPKGGIEFDNLSGEKGYSAWRAYGQSKFANLLFAKELARRFSGTARAANALHPGVIFDTNLQRSMNVPRVVLDAVAGLSNLLVLKSIPEGAATQCYVTTNPALAAVSGEYFADCNKVAVARRTKNGSPTPLHLPSIVVAALANIRADDGRVFRFSKSGRLHALMTQAEKASG